jgi:large subunit ribosomal protein L4
MDQPKTKAFADTMKTLSSTNALIVTAEGNPTLTLSSRNVPGTKVLSSDGLNVYDILKYEKLVLLEGAIKKIEGRLLS